MALAAVKWFKSRIRLFIIIIIVLLINFFSRYIYFTRYICYVSKLFLRTFAPKSSYGESFFISPLELVLKVLTPKMRKKMGITDFASEKMAVEKCLNFDKS